MHIEIITIGNELLNGDLADTNTRTLAARLRSLGLGVVASSTVPDEIQAISGALRAASSRSELVFVTGGLGPTDDDLTLRAAAAFADCQLQLHTEALGWIQENYKRRGRSPLPSHRQQAMLPLGATPLRNSAGIAPGVRMVAATTTFFFFPGVPRELRAIFDEHVIPWIDANVAHRSRSSHTFRTFGLTEAQVAQRLEALQVHPSLHVAYRARFPEIQVTLHVEHEEASEDASLLETFRDQARMLLGDIVYSECRQTDLAQLIANRMASFENAPTVSVAESCTGGLVGKLLTDASGVSSWFIESAVCYANDAKVRRLGVSESTLQEHGAVSKATALAMARGIRQQAGTDIGLATTGIAGPSGGTPDKPVGTIHVALSHGTGEVHRLLNLSFGRSRNRTITAWVALDLLRRHLDLR